MAGDAEKLWNHEQGKRAHEIAGNAEMAVVPSAKLSRKDIADQDVAILSLPPLALRRKAQKSTEKKEPESE
jgi:hypothetical protein